VKQQLKATARALAALAVSPVTLLDLCTAPFAGDTVFTALSQLLSLLPGKTGSYLRVGFYRFAMRHCDPDCFIGFGTLFAQRDTMIGKGVYIGPQCNIGASRIGAHSLIASGVHIMSGTEQHYFARLDRPIREQGGVFTPVDIGEDCWIGNGVLVMADIGRGSVVGAGSVVTRDLGALSIAVGNPARVLRQRGEVGPDPEHDALAGSPLPNVESLRGSAGR
jgi:acetyltransferase-like isoleucine patch superfamily enzyme